MEHEPLILEQEFNAPIKLVWQAISDGDLLKKWFFDVSNFEPVLGCQFHFEGGEANKRYTHICEVLEVVPNRKLRFSWSYKGYVGLSFVTFELTPIGDKTKLKLIHEGLDTFTNKDFSRDNFIGGWKYLIQKSLFEFLENGKALRYW